mgnify:CR=1 FL=1
MPKERIVQQPQTVQAQKQFSQLPSADVQRSTFDRSHGYKSTFDAGQIIPFLVDEILPGDTFSCNTTLFLRLATPIKPLFDNIQADIHYFFVPNRLTWDNWEKFMGERTNPDDDPSTLTIPVANVDLSTIRGNLPDYAGLPATEVPTNVQINVLPFRAMRLIFNDWYRDENLQDSFVINTGDGPETITASPPNIRGKRKDYFTSALPWPQKGDPVFLPLGIEAPVVSDGDGFPSFVNDSGENLGRLQQLQGAGNNAEFEVDTPSGGVAGWSNTKLVADLQTATAATINDIRTSFQIQRMLERDARGGTRYIELIMSHFNVQSADARLQRPEYLGGGTGVININPVAQTTPTDIVPDVSPQGNLAATGTGIIRGGFTHSFTEHGYLIGFVSARADLTYQNGIERMWSRQTRYDFYWPTLAHLGEQEILNKEIYVSGDATDEDTWGYQERFAEYRYKPGRITGKMRSNDPESLDIWHLAQDFNALPPLNGSFIQENPPIDRISAVPTEPDFLCDGWIKMSCTRPMPIYSVPGLVDHF